MKRTLSIIGIGAAFGAVSLWVWLTRGKNAKAVKAKFRLGGALLTLTSALSLWSRCRAASEQLYGTFDRVDPVIEGC